MQEPLAWPRREDAVWVEKAAWALVGMGDSGTHPGPWGLNALLFAMK